MNRFMRAAAVITGTVLLISTAACGDKDDKKEKSSSSGGNVGKEYCPVIPVTGKKMTVDQNVDEYLEKSKTFYTEDFKHRIFKLDDGSFDILDLRQPNLERSFAGNYKIEDGKILFDYKTATVKNKGEKTVYDIDDEDNNDSDGVKKALLQSMKEFNETGTFFNTVGSPLQYSDIVNDYTVMPLVIQNFRGNTRPKGVPVFLHIVDDFLCVPTYGFDLNGDYSCGNDFTVTYNPLAAYLDDEYSVYYTNDYENTGAGGRTMAENLEEIITQQAGNTEDISIEFSDGNWEMYNSEGEFLNNGVYSESEDYEGMIAMFVTEDSAKTFSHYQALCPLFFYINDGEIWYPYMIKAD